MKLPLVASAVLGTFAAPPDGAHPVVVVGPLLGQSLEAKIEGGSCDTGGQYHWHWGNKDVGSLLGHLGCFLDSMEPHHWDPNTQRTVPKPGVSFRPLGGFEHDGFQAIGTLFGSPVLDQGEGLLVPLLVKEGYEVGQSLYGHAYDWRLGVGDWSDQSFPALKEKVERGVGITGQKAVLTGVSMAGPYTHAFLSWVRQQDPEWASRNVHAFAPMNGPFNGAVMALSAVLSSVIDTFIPPAANCPECIPQRNNSIANPTLIDKFKEWIAEEIADAIDHPLKNIVWKWPSMYFMSTAVDYSTNPPTDPELVTLVNGALPDECYQSGELGSKCGDSTTRGGWKFDDDSFLRSSECADCQEKGAFETCPDGFERAAGNLFKQLCCRRHQCPAKTYRASELPDLLREVGRPESADLMSYTQSVHTTSDPGVPVHCILSHNVQTWEHLSFTTTEDMQSAIVRLGNGDATVDSASLDVCKRWPSTVKVYEIPGVTHGGILSEQHALGIVRALALNLDEEWQSWSSPHPDDTTPTARAGVEALLKRPEAVQLV